MKWIAALAGVPFAVVLLVGGALSDDAGASSATSTATTPSGSAAAFPGGTSGCTLPDPTGTGGCITPTTAWLLTQIRATFGALPATCWDAHAWNPTSDHPKGKACDVFFGKTGTFPGPADVTRGWALATWLQTNATALHVSYVIWQGHIWSPARAAQGWRTYTGGGIYNPDDPTGGHYDHVHVSVTS